MLKPQCPGQDSRYWKPQDVVEEPCPFCGEILELWKDDARRRCGGCGKVVRNPHFGMGCAKWCRFASQCLGIPDSWVKDESLCDMLVREMRKVFGTDQRRIRHAYRVLDFAEQILRQHQADPLVVMSAAILHDIGIHQAERKHGSSAGKYQQIEGPPIARKILTEAGVDRKRIEHVCNIVADHHTAKTMDTPEFRILWDADNLVNLFVEGQKHVGDAEELINKVFKTHAGAQIARRLAFRDSAG